MLQDILKLEGATRPRIALPTPFFHRERNACDGIRATVGSSGDAIDT
jgi:hypothetical protein